METSGASEVEFRRAAEFLASAQANLKARRTTAAAEEAFLAADRAASGLLMLLGFAPKTHQGAARLFGKELVIPGHVEPDYGRTLSRLDKIRSRAVYGRTALLPPERAREAVRMAEEFVRRAERAAKSLR